MAVNVEEKMYVALGKEVEESKSTLSWTLANCTGKKLCILHVHQPAKTMSFGVGVSSATISVEEREMERQIMHKLMDYYILLCNQAGVSAEKLVVESDDIGEGIVELLYRHGIRKLVMGGAANSHYSEGLRDLKSKKAIYVKDLVPSCQIWFTCNSHLIHSGDGDLVGLQTGVSSVSLQPDSTDKAGQSSPSAPCEPELRASAAFQRVQAPDAMAIVLVESPQPEPDVQIDAARHMQSDQTDMKTICRVNALENLYSDELRKRKELEEDLAKAKTDLETIKKKWDEERLTITEQKQILDVLFSTVNHKERELEDKCSSMTELLRVCEKERDHLRVQCDNSLKVTEDLLKKQDENNFFSKFSYAEIKDVTCYFDESSKIGEGGYGNVYKGFLRHTPVAIKVLNQDSLQGPAEFSREVELLSKLRHPNVVTLIGVCPEACALIYEYLPNGSLEDRLSCKDNSSPLSWQIRVRIAAELCSILMFLHSSNLGGIVHRDLNPQNILLDANFVCKLSDFGICHILSASGSSSNATTNHISDPRGSFSYLDPHVSETGELSVQSDIYSFGVILLKLLTGRSSVVNIAEEMKAVLDEGNLNAILDPLAGDWPFVQANQLAHLALRCCDTSPSNQPDLASDVWNVLEPMRSSCQASSPFHLGPEERSNPPSYFMCPIYQEVMLNPRVAADGYTYEEEALKGWIDSGHDTSPMTNLKLENFNLVPNHALRSAIQEWQQQA